MMLVSYDVESGATYVELGEGEVVETVSVSDLVMVDLDTRGEPLGVDFAVAPNRITDQMLGRLTDAFPALKELQHTERWLLSRT
jgi:uncharacterized protein YuzE